MTPGTGFVVFLAVTLVFLGAVFVTGFKAQRKRHIPCVAGAVISLLITIYYAEKLGETLDLESAGRIYPVHLAFAKATTASYLAPLISGFLTLKRPAVRKVHRILAITVLALTLVTAVTGTWMVIAAEPLAPAS